MKKYKFKVLFKNGVFSEFESESEDLAIQELIDHLELIYGGKTKGIIQIGRAFVNPSEIVYVEIEELETEIIK